MEAPITCEECGEENKSGSTRCARCGATLTPVAGSVVDPELRAFQIAQAHATAKNNNERFFGFLRRR